MNDLFWTNVMADPNGTAEKNNDRQDAIVPPWEKQTPDLWKLLAQVVM